MAQSMSISPGLATSLIGCRGWRRVDPRYPRLMLEVVAVFADSMTLMLGCKTRDGELVTLRHTEVALDEW